MEYLVLDEGQSSPCAPHLWLCIGGNPYSLFGNKFKRISSYVYRLGSLAALKAHIVGCSAECDLGQFHSVQGSFEWEMQ